MSLFWKNTDKGGTYSSFFRLFFVVFFLYLAGNLFHIWSGYKGYASAEFLHALSLVSVFWTLMASVAALLIFLIFRAIVWMCGRAGWNICVENLFLYSGLLMLVMTLTWAGKKIIFPDIHMTFRMGLIVLVSGAIISILPAWLLRGRAKPWMDSIQGIITPFVWVFGIAVVLSVPLTAKNVWQEIQNIKSENIYKAENGRPLVTFVFDDGFEKTYSRAMPILQAQGEVACAAIVLNYIGIKDRMTAAQILALQNGGWEILGHSISHPDLTTLSGADIENELKTSKEGFIALGFSIKNFVYPFYRHNANARVIAKKYYRSARAGDVSRTGFDINPRIMRIFAMSAIDINVFDHLTALEGIVDDAEANNSWLMITAHNLNPEKEALLKNIIDYIQEKGIEIVTIDQGLDFVGDKEVSRLAQLLYLLNVDSPFHILRNVHIASQRILSLLQ